LSEDREPRRRGGGSDPTPQADIVVRPVPAETPGAPIEVARPERKVDKRDSLAVRNQVPPRWPEDAALSETILARHVQWERRRERRTDVKAPDRMTKGRADLPLAHPLGTTRRRFGNPLRSWSSVHPAASRR